jgi:hypothetical protein
MVAMFTLIRLIYSLPDFTPVTVYIVDEISILYNGDAVENNAKFIA